MYDHVLQLEDGTTTIVNLDMEPGWFYRTIIVWGVADMVSSRVLRNAVAVALLLVALGGTGLSDVFAGATLSLTANWFFTKPYADKATLNTQVSGDYTGLSLQINF